MLWLLASHCLSQRISFETFALNDLNCPFNQLNTTGCTSCPSYFYPTKVALFSVCQPCSAGCTSCQSSALCTVCDSEYQLDNGTCVCNNQITNCTLNITCPPSAYPDYVLKACQSCSLMLGCATCSSANNCSSCSPGFNPVPQNNTCQLCPKFCMNCTATACVSCFQGYSQNSSGVCVGETGQNAACPPSTYSSMGNCVACSLGLNCRYCRDQSTCTACNPGYYLVSLKYNTTLSLILCEACPPGCSACVSSVQCVSCVDGTQDCLTQPCLAISQGCTSCTYGTGSSQLYCTHCSTGEYLSSSFLCVECPAHCVYCSSQTQCQGCIDGYYLIQQVCAPCPSNCLACSGNTQCSSCQLGYYYSNGACLPCTAHCYYCLSAQCLVCQAGFQVHNKACRQIEGNSGAIIGLSAAVGNLLIILISLVYFFVKKPASSHHGVYMEIN